MENLRQKLYNRISDEISYEREVSDEELHQIIDRVILEESRKTEMSYREKKKYREILFSSFRGLDVLSLAMKDPDITEIMVNGADHIFVERHGGLEDYIATFTTEEKLSDVVQKIASSVNRRVNEASPMVDARLSDGSRVNIVLPPIALDGPAVTIRRFPKEPVSMEKLISFGSVTKEATGFLRMLVEAGYNIFISGGTGAGKTTFLGALAEFIPENERVITIEDSAELRLRNVKNIVRLESRPPNMEGEYEVTIRSLIRNALRMRPDRIIVGECRGAEALDMLQAMNTGHDGSISTGHANSAPDMLARLETMVLMGMELPLSAIRSQISSGIDILVHLGRLRNRQRKVMGIYEVLDLKEGNYQIAPLYEFCEREESNGKISGKLQKTNQRLKNTEKLERYFGEKYKEIL